MCGCFLTMHRNKSLEHISHYNDLDANFPNKINGREWKGTAEGDRNIGIHNENLRGTGLASE